MSPRTRILSLWASMTLITAMTDSLSAATADSAEYRLAGVVWISPTCAGAQREGDPCREPLAGVEVRLSDSAGRIQGTARTDANGAFAIRAPLGQYRLHVVGLTKVPRCPELAITL